MASLKKNYDAFLSFRGTDVRKNFLSHLYTTLDQNGIHTFVDSEELRKGEQILPTLVKVIEESHTMIIIFSKDYASSRWCLEELVKIMECKAQKRLIMLPVFYKVEPREVRRAYKRNMAKHETEFGKDSKTMEGWKKALFEAGSLSRWHINDGDEAKLIRGIIEEVSSHLEQITPLHVADCPVGIDSRVQEVISLLQKKLDDDDVLMIGLWRPGGIGKTTLAKAIYNAIERQFQGGNFLDRVRETSNKSDGLVDLQRKLLSRILSPKHPTVYTKDGGISLIRERLCRKKVLFVLDDVDQLDQLKALAGGGNWFGKGSRIFVTTRDRYLLTSSPCESCVYEVETLKSDEAVDLFVWHAFPNSIKVEIRRDLIDRALHYASGFPLALEVLGSFLCGINERAWESALHKLSKSPYQAINRVLITSFEALDNNEREIFLDIACFFKGKSKEYIEEVLNGCEFYTTIGIEILIQRSLIRNECGTLQMHDLVQLTVYIFSKDPIRLPYNLRWLKYPNAPVLDFGFGLKKLIGLDVQKCHIQQLEVSVPDVSSSPNLESLNLDGCFSVPDVSSSPNLESLNLDGCKSLVEIHQYVTYHGKLKFLSLQFCSNLSIFPHALKTKSLQALDIFGCSKLEKFFDIPEKMEHLEELDRGLTAIKELSTLVENLLSVKIINLSKCKRLTTLSSSVYKLQNLEDLNLEGFSNFVMFPKDLEDSTNPNGNPRFGKLNQLNLSGCNLSQLEFLESSSSFTNLAHLDLSHNKFIHLLLQKITQLPPNVHALYARCCRSLQEFPDLSGVSSTGLVVDFSSCREFFRKGANAADVLSLKELPKMRNVGLLLIGREMPEWFIPCKTDGSISFMVPGDLYDKFLGLALCFVLDLKEGKAVYPGCGIDILVNGQNVVNRGSSFYSLKSDHVWIKNIPRRGLYQMCKEREVLRDDQNHFQVYLSVSRGRLEKCGSRLIYEQQEDELRIELQHHQPMETNWSLEERDSEEDNWIDTEEEESSSETDDELIKAIDQGKEKRLLSQADKLDLGGSYACLATGDLCRSLKTLSRERILRKKGY
ncbi:hypothetical protein BT93_G0392 [Corymbia citriodora subsp. variegata]|nr:hypothetical protein BT93_G0392 [Corymbia citriodora subsp. variegata]